MRIAMRILSALVACAALAVPSVADVPTNMNVQGILTDGSGDPVPAGPKDFTFKIFDQAVGGTEIWPAGPGEMQTLVTDADGLWKAAVGTNVALTSAVFEDTSRWLEVTVDDGVNPPETLPRMKLNTVPYSFNAAAVGGSTPGDLANQFVNVPGDTMTGRLKIVAPWKDAVNASFHTLNINDANGPHNLNGNTIAIMGDAKSDGDEGKYALVGYAAGDTGSTVGLYAQGDGYGAFNVGVYGAVNPNGISNYSGYFYGGDFSVSAPDTPGDSAVQLPNNSIGDQEILNEPGIAQSVLVGDIDLSPSYTSQDFLSVTLTIPDAGYIVLDGRASYSHSGDNQAFGWVQISDTSNSGPATSFVWTGRWESAGYTGYDYQLIPVRRVFFKPAGTYTFYLQGNEYFFNDAGSNVVALTGATTLLATYFPSSYGAVSTLADAPHDPGSAVGAASIRGPGEPSAPVEIVDLRDLELRALRARAEAERAERELAEAQLRLGPVGAPQQE